MTCYRISNVILQASVRTVELMPPVRLTPSVINRVCLQLTTSRSVESGSKDDGFFGTYINA